MSGLRCSRCGGNKMWAVTPPRCIMCGTLSEMLPVADQSTTEGCEHHGGSEMAGNVRCTKCGELLVTDIRPIPGLYDAAGNRLRDLSEAELVKRDLVLNQHPLT